MNQKIEQENEELEISKTQIKREAEELKVLGKELVELSKKQLAQIPGSELLFHAIAVAHKISNKNEALRRQIQYIGKVLRNEDIEQIRLKIDKLQNKHQQLTHANENLELLCKELIELGDQKINELIAEHPELERQKMRQMVRQANKEKKAEKIDKYAKIQKEIFTYLKPYCL